MDGCKPLPGKSGSCFRNSAMMHPTAHMSTDALYFALPSSSSGARYQSVAAQVEFESKT